MNTIKITNAMREFCLAMAEGRRVFQGVDDWERYMLAGLVVDNIHGDGWELSTAGEHAAAEAKAKRNARNRAARGRSDAMRILGLVKTPYGWE